jgi:Kef-type K+ transport system membrane component KefB
MMITPEVIGEHSFERLENTCEVLTASLFGPLFLAYQGLQFNLQTLTQPAFVVSLVAVAVVAKLLSGYLVGRLQRMTSHEAWGVGIIMNARGVMELVVASIAFNAGLVDAAVFSALLVVGLVTTVLTPLMLKRWQTAAPVADATKESVRAP